MGMVRTHFRPEYLNRIDEIILFHRLQKSEMGAIVEIQFGRLRRLLEDRKIDLVLDAKGRDWLAEKGWDPAYGARPLKRVIQRSVQDPLAEMILAGDVRDGATVKNSAGKDGLTFTGKAVDAGEADKADHLDLPLALARLHTHGEGAHMAVGGFLAVGMLDADVFAVASF